MASNIAFSPKEWEVWILGESTLGTAVTANSGMYQLDVDSVSMPSLGLNQSIDLRNTSGRTFNDEDDYDI